MAASFLYTCLESVVLKISALPELAFVNRRNPNDLLRFKFDKLAAAVKRSLFRTSRDKCFDR